MDKITHGKILVGSISNSIKLSKVYGNLNLKQLYLLDIIGDFLFSCKELDFETEKKLKSLYNAIQHNSKSICNYKKKDLISYKGLFYSDVNDVNSFINSKDFKIINKSISNDTIVQITEQPFVDNSSATIINDYTFSYNDFTTNFNDPRGGQPGTVKIITLPTIGKLTFKGVDITDSFEFNISDITDLVYVLQNTTAPVTDVLNFQTSNNDINKIFSNMASFTFNINEAVNQPPSIVGNNSKTIENGSTYIFTVADFTTDTSPVYSDPEGDEASMLRITSLPVDGVLQFNGVNVTLNQVIPFQGTTSINDGSFRYVSEQNSPNADVETFNFQISDTGSGQFTG